MKVLAHSWRRVHPGPWDIALGALGLNLWASLLFVPLLHLGSQAPLTARMLAILPLPVLALGVFFRNGALLLALFPAALVAPPWLHGPLASPAIYGGPAFGLVALALLAYLVGAPWALTRTRRPASISIHRELPDTVSNNPRWRRRMRVYAYLCVFAAAFPAALLHALYFRSGAADELARHYPERGAEAGVLFGLVLLAIWIAVFLVFLARPTVAHIRGDHRLKESLRRAQRRARRSQVGAPFFAAVLVTVVAIGLFLLRLFG